MNLKKSIEPITVLKTRSAQLIEEAREARQPIVITQNGKATAVLQDVESYEDQRHALLMLKALAQGDQELKAGQGLSQNVVSKHFDKKLQQLKHA